MVTDFILYLFRKRFHLIYEDKELRLFVDLYDNHDTSFICYHSPNRRPDCIFREDPEHFHRLRTFLTCMHLDHTLAEEIQFTINA